MRTSGGSPTRDSEGLASNSEGCMSAFFQDDSRGYKTVGCGLELFTFPRKRGAAFSFY